METNVYVDLALVLTSKKAVVTVTDCDKQRSSKLEEKDKNLLAKELLTLRGKKEQLEEMEKVLTGLLREHMIATGEEEIAIPEGKIVKGVETQYDIDSNGMKTAATPFLRKLMWETIETFSISNVPGKNKVERVKYLEDNGMGKFIKKLDDKVCIKTFPAKAKK